MEVSELLSMAFSFFPAAFLVQSLLKRSQAFGTSSGSGSGSEGRSEFSATEGGSERDFGEQTRVLDKLCYMLGVLNVALTAFLAGSLPTRFYLWHTPKAVVLTALRWYSFRKQRQHYLLYDFCYFANALTLWYIWMRPHDAVLFQVMFVAAFGPLAWASFVFGHSVIFHSYSHMTSVFIHVSPMLLVFGLRWHPTPDFTVCDDYPACKVSMSSLVWKGLSRFYIWWIALYYIWVFVVLHHRVQSRGYQTLFDRVVAKQIKWLATIHPNLFVQKALFAFIHLCLGTLGMTVAAGMWHSYWAQVAFILGIICTVSYNAAGYYFTVFLQTYEKELAVLIAKRRERPTSPMSPVSPVSPPGPWPGASRK